MLLQLNPAASVTGALMQSTMMVQWFTDMTYGVASLPPKYMSVVLVEGRTFLFTPRSSSRGLFPCSKVTRIVAQSLTFRL